MADKTPNLALTKPAETDFYDISVFNENADKIDTTLAEITTQLSNKANITDDQFQHLGHDKENSWFQSPTLDEAIKSGLYRMIDSDGFGINVIVMGMESESGASQGITCQVAMSSEESGILYYRTGIRSSGTIWNWGSWTSVDRRAIDAQKTAEGAAALAKYYGTCATAAGTTAKAATCSGFTLEAGVRISITFTYANTVSAPTLNVSSTGAKTISRLSNWEAGTTVDFVYDGTYWRMVEIAAQKSYYGTCATTAATAAKAVTCTSFYSGALVPGARVTVLFTYANTAASPTLNVNSAGAKSIYRNSTLAASGAWEAGQTIDFVYDGTYWRMVNGPALSANIIATGTWTPYISSPYAINYATGHYTKIGNLVTVSFHLNVESNVTGTAILYGLPYVPSGYFAGGGTMEIPGLSFTPGGYWLQSGAACIYPMVNNTSGGFVNASFVKTYDMVFSGTIMYYTSA